MELGLIALIVLCAIVLVLQIVSLLLIAATRKTIANLREARPSPAPQADRFDKRNNDFRRHEKRPFQEQRPQRPQAPQQAQQAQADPVEKSLRDINMRLKNADRDMEFARRKRQDNFSFGDNRGEPRGDRGERGDNHRNRDPRGGGGHRDHHRGHRRDNWQERNRYGGSDQQQPMPQSALPQSAVQEKTEMFPPVAPIDIQTPVLQTPPVTESVVKDFNADESFQHGRKIIVKRRPLGDESQDASATEAVSATGAPVQTPSVSPEEETTVTPEPGPDTEISFGRGRR